jgi:hypothetical protein
MLTIVCLKIAQGIYLALGNGSRPT